MIKYLILLLLLAGSGAVAQNALPIDTLPAASAGKPLVFYISGDGGWNNFSRSFMKEWNKQGYPVLGLNAKTYFWKQKTPQAAAKDVTTLLTQYLKQWACTEVILIGYSFGADVTPFVQTRLAADLGKQIKLTVLMSPSKKTDFEIHVLGSVTDGQSVSAEINKLKKPVFIIFGEDEEATPEKEIKNPQVQIKKLGGGHHYDGNVAAIVQEIADKLR